MTGQVSKGHLITKSPPSTSPQEDLWVRGCLSLPVHTLEEKSGLPNLRLSSVLSAARAKPLFEFGDLLASPGDTGDWEALFPSTVVTPGFCSQQMGLVLWVHDPYSYHAVERSWRG